MPIKFKKSSMKYKNSSGEMEDLGLPVGKYETDSTLTKQGTPADAKTVGDKFKNLDTSTPIYNVSQDNNADFTSFEVAEIDTNRTLHKGDMLITPSSKLYQIVNVESTFVEAQYLSTVQNTESIVQLLIQELQGLPMFGVFDGTSTITLTNMLPSGTYTLKHKDSSGVVQDIGTATIEATQTSFSISGDNYTVPNGTTWYTFATEQGWSCYSEGDGVWDADYSMCVVDENGEYVSGGDIIKSSHYEWT